MYLSAVNKSGSGAASETGTAKATAQINAVAFDLNLGS